MKTLIIDKNSNFSHKGGNTARLASESPVEVSGTRQASSNVLTFLRTIDDMIELGVPSTHVWNYCALNRKAVLRSAEGRD